MPCARRSGTKPARCTAEDCASSWTVRHRGGSPQAGRRPDARCSHRPVRRRLLLALLHGQLLRPSWDKVSQVRPCRPDGRGGPNAQFRALYHVGEMRHRIVSGQNPPLVSGGSYCVLSRAVRRSLGGQSNLLTSRRDPGSRTCPRTVSTATAIPVRGPPDLRALQVALHELDIQPFGVVREGRTVGNGARGAVTARAGQRPRLDRDALRRTELMVGEPRFRPTTSPDIPCRFGRGNRNTRILA
ncbi:hypothetical protein HNR67_003556 [Crossiella cryophila]|uniref:Uncharacterized protein n=1 Tax=Crossiella cryophila TaxID=43355 RepID=A0A7W7FUG6_9PSEU|nr:hypothetical protein [Crossiella cryophila]